MTIKGKGKAGGALKKKVSSRGNGKPNSQLLQTKNVDLEGHDRAFVIRAIERIPANARTIAERNLLKKVR